MKMMKTTITTVLAFIIGIAGIKAQTIQDGINHLYADRDKSAKAVFEKMVAANPNNMEAVYWLGQTYIAMENMAAAKDLYSKTLASNGNAPLVLAGMGQVELSEGKKNEARQRFETAITIATGKKGVDANVLDAIGRANVYVKEGKGDIAYAIEKLKQATTQDPKNVDAYLTLGDAYRKAHAGGDAVTAYSKASELNPSLARGDYRIAKIYETQRNWDVYENYLNKALTKDPKFAPAYYELYYYYLYKLDFAKAEEYSKKYLQDGVSDVDPQNDYLRLQVLYKQKKYDEAIAGLKALISAAGDQTKSRTYKLLAYNYVEKGDTASAKEWIDKYFAVADPEDILPPDWILKGKIYAAVTGDQSEVFNSYVQAAALDSVYKSKMDILQEGADYFKEKGDKEMQGQMGLVIYKNKQNPNHADLFNPGLAFYQAKNYTRADSVFKVYMAAYPDSMYGVFWDARALSAIDTTMTLGLAVPVYEKTLQLASTDKVKYKSQGVESAGYLAGYQNNIKKDPSAALVYINKALEFDSTNNYLLNTKKILEGRNRPTPPAKRGTPGKPSASAQKAAAIKNTKAIAKK